MKQEKVTPKHCMLIQYDDCSLTDCLGLWRQVPLRHDVLYLCFKNDLTPADSFFVKELAGTTDILDCSSLENTNEQIELEPGRLYHFDRARLNKAEFRIDKAQMFIDTPSTASDGKQPDSIFQDSLKVLADIMEVWAAGSTLVITSPSDPHATALVRLAWQSCANVMPLSTETYPHLCSVAEVAFIAGHYKMLSMNEVVDYVKEGFLTRLAKLQEDDRRIALEIAEHGMATKAISEQINHVIKRTSDRSFTARALTTVRDLYVLDHGILEDILEETKEDLSYPSKQKLLEDLEYFQPAMHYVIKKVMEALRSKHPPINQLLTICDKVSEYFIKNSEGFWGPIRVWILNAGTEELPFLVYDRLAQILQASLDRPHVPRGLSVFATHPVTHMRRPRVDARKLNEVKLKGLELSKISSQLNEVRNEINNRKYSSNVVLAKHAPGVDPPYRNIDVLMTNGIHGVMDENISKVFFKSLRRSLRKGAFMIVSADEFERYSAYFNAEGLKLRNQDLDITGECYAFQFS